MPIILTLLLMMLHAHSFSVPGPHLIREYKVSDEKAGEIIREKLNFLRLTYEQYQHPDYKYVKFPHDCLKAIEMNDAAEGNFGLLSRSTVFYGENFQTGLCPQHINSVKGAFVLLYCRKTSTLFQIRCEADQCEKISWGEKC